MIQTENALIVVDYENSFIPVEEGGTGELGVEGGGLLAPRINELMRETKTAGGLVIASRDWHPKNHISFASRYPGKKPFETLESGQELWPDHCVAGTKGSEYFSDLDTSLIDYEIIKGYKVNKDSYSAFEGREMVPYDILPNPGERKEAEMIEKGWQISEAKNITQILTEAGVKVVKIVGLATDFCVKATAIDSVKNGFKAIIDSSAVRGVAVSPGETIAYLEALREKEGVDYK